MQKQTNKNFDDAFKLAFENAEIQPPKDFWPSIEPKIKPKKNNKIGYWFSAAACIAVVLFANLFFFKTENKIQLRGSEVANNVETETQKPATTAKNETVNKVETTLKNTKNIPANETNQTDTENTKQKENFILTQMQPLQLSAHLPYVGLEKNINYVETEISKPNLIAKNEEAKTEKDTIQPTKKMNLRDIQSIGGLVNFIVNRIDNREKKLIKFKENEDENTGIIAFNLNFKDTKN